MRSHTDRGRRPQASLVLLPWLVYVGVTVVAPAANGATRDPAFAEHTIVTLGVSVVVAMLWLAAGTVRNRRRVLSRTPARASERRSPSRSDNLPTLPAD